jgi:hypothetical protein
MVGDIERNQHFLGKEWQGDTLRHSAHYYAQLRIVGVEPAIDKV